MIRTKFYKRISIFLGILVLFSLTIVFSSRPVLAQEVNLCLDGTASFSIITSRACTWYQTAAYVKDNDTGTKVGFYGNEYQSGGEDANAIGQYEAIVEFPNASTVNSVDYYRYWKLQGTFGVTGWERVSLYYEGAWHLINTQNYSSNGSGTGTITITSGAPWNNVTKVKIEAYMHGKSSGPYAKTAIAAHYTYELRAFGEAAPTYIDIGLRVYDGAATVNIACCDPAGTETSPLKIVGTDGITSMMLL